MNMLTDDQIMLMIDDIERLQRKYQGEGVENDRFLADLKRIKDGYTPDQISLNQVHAHPWAASEGWIRNNHGDVIGNYPYTLGDETDRKSGELMARAPEILEAAGLALRTINDTLRHENLSAGGYEALAAAAGDLQKILRLFELSEGER